MELSTEDRTFIEERHGQDKSIVESTIPVNHLFAYSLELPSGTNVRVMEDAYSINVEVQA